MGNRIYFKPLPALMLALCFFSARQQHLSATDLTKYFISCQNKTWQLSSMQRPK